MGNKTATRQLPAKTDGTGHSDAPALSAPQAAALELVALGKNDTETAEAVGITRQTVNGWKNHDPAFMAAVNARRRELWAETHDRLRGLAVRAVDILAAALDAELDKAIPAAVHILKALGVYGNAQPPQGPTLALGVLVEQARANAQERIAARPPDLDELNRLLNGGRELAELAGKEYDRLKEEWDTARQEAPGSTKEEGAR